jgi:hypothetical protein
VDGARDGGDGEKDDEPQEGQYEEVRHADRGGYGGSVSQA